MKKIVFNFQDQRIPHPHPPAWMVLSPGLCRNRQPSVRFKGVNILCDIGNGTMNVMTITNGRPISSQMLHGKVRHPSCTLLIRERLIAEKFHVTIEDA
jgi:hypothetical protein